MNETKKTGLFWVAAGVSLAIAAAVAWPSASRDDGGVAPLINTDLFAEFKDPLTAASMKIVTFDEEQGKLATFEVRKDRESGAWTIPSRDGYPADAVEQMKDAANALVDLKILDVQTENAEDHDDLGVAEPKLEELEVGDTGVGRLVTFKDASQKNLASLIIGDPVKDREGQRYVRKPGQDPVYVVSLDDSPLTTQFNAWIEDDLLQLSSIDIENVEIKDYNASLGLSGLSLSRNYNAKVSMDGSQWKLDELSEFDKNNPNADPKKVELGDDEQLNTTRLNDLKNALDDLKIADVVRKPKGMSENLRADKELVSDNEAVASLAQRGFYPASGSGGQVEILSANGEMTVGLKDGVKYVLRFGNVSGLTEEGDEEPEEGEEDQSSDGLNRYLLVTTLVDESKFPPPDLQEVPKTLEDLEALLGELDGAATKDLPAELNDPDADSKAEAKKEMAGGEEAESDSASSSEETEKADEPKDAGESKDADDANAEDAKSSDETEAVDEGAADESKADDVAEDAVEEASGETDAAGSGEATVSGGAQDVDEDASGDQDDADSSGESEEKDSGTTDDGGSDSEGDKANASSTPDDAEDTTAEDKTAEDDAAEDGKKESADEAPADPDESMDKSEPVGELDELTDEEKQERLEAEQEKITKENQRKLDERKDKIDAAKRRVAELNARFADWYYVIPESTYSDLRIQRSELIQSKADAAGSSGAPGGMPPGGFGGGLPPGFGN